MRRPTALLALPAFILLAACGGTDTPDAPDTEMNAATMEVNEAREAREVEERRFANMIGVWNQVSPIQMTSGDYNFTLMNGTVRYGAEGWHQLTSILVVDGLEDGENSYRISLDGTYILEGSQMRERFRSAAVSPVVANDKTRTIAAAIEEALGQAGTTESIIVRAEEDVLVRRIDGINATIRYERGV